VDERQQRRCAEASGLVGFKQAAEPLCSVRFGCAGRAARTPLRWGSPARIAFRVILALGDERGLEGLRLSRRRCVHAAPQTIEKQQLGSSTVATETFSAGWRSGGMNVLLTFFEELVKIDDRLKRILLAALISCCRDPLRGIRNNESKISLGCSALLCSARYRLPTDVDRS